MDLGDLIKASEGIAAMKAAEEDANTCRETELKAYRLAMRHADEFSAEEVAFLVARMAELETEINNYSRLY